MAEKVATRHAYGESLAEIGADTRIIALDTDVSTCTMSVIFGEKYPERFFNCGIAEGNMIGMAAGLFRSWIHTVCTRFRHVYGRPGI